MASKYLGREDAPFDEKIWEALDGVVIAAAKAQLSARKLVDIEGPYGLDTKSVPLQDRPAVEGGVSIASSGVLPIPLIEATFSLSVRDLATFEETGFSLDSEAISRAAMEVAVTEDALIFEGSKSLGIEGLLNAKGALSVKLGKWEEVGAAASDIIRAVSTLDEAGFHGPYVLGLAPALHNLLHRIYPQGNQSEMRHVESIVGGKVVKAPGIKQGGVLLASGKQFASIVIGQDMTTGFIGPAGSGYEFKISESLAPRVRVPSSVCVLKT
jgi:uncharacterized linocin/CFP29 family protein